MPNKLLVLLLSAALFLTAADVWAKGKSSAHPHIQARAFAGLSLARFRALSRTRQVAVLKATIDFLEKFERTERFDSASAFDWFRLLESAQAQEDSDTDNSEPGNVDDAPSDAPPDAKVQSTPYDCLYAGWPSQTIQSGGRRLCTHPSRGNPSYSKFAGSCNGPGQMACNPALFGDGLCTKTGNYAFSKCVSGFRAGGRKLSDVAAKIASTPELGALYNEMEHQVEAVCHAEGSLQSRKAMCRAFERQIAELSSELHAAASSPAAAPAPASTSTPTSSPASAPNLSPSSFTGELDIAGAIRCHLSLPWVPPGIYPDGETVLPIQTGAKQTSVFVLTSKEGHDDIHKFADLPSFRSLFPGFPSGAYPQLMLQADQILKDEPDLKPLKLTNGSSSLTPETRKLVAGDLTQQIGKLTSFYVDRFNDAKMTDTALRNSGSSLEDMLKKEIPAVQLVLTGDKLTARQVTDQMIQDAQNPKNSQNSKDPKKAAANKNEETEVVNVLPYPVAKEYEEALNNCEAVGGEPNLKKAVEAERTQFRAALQGLGEPTSAVPAGGEAPKQDNKSGTGK